MIDLVFALTISMVLFYSVLNIYESYYINKTNYKMQIKVNDILSGICLEIKNNMSFEALNSLQKGKKIFLNINDIQDLINNNLEELMDFEEKNIEGLWSINVWELEKDKNLNIEIKYKDSNNKTKYNLKEVVTKSVYIE